ncbi:MAG: hypothetical protein ACHQ6T_03115 [Myxococcota bacterium]
MKTSFLISRCPRVAALCGAALALAACAGERGPAPAEWRPLEPAHAAREPLPDDAERIAARLAAAVLASRPREADAENAALIREDEARKARGELPSGLVDNAAELLAARAGSDTFPERAGELLARDDLDPALRRRLELAREAAPLEVADTRLTEELRAKWGTVFNRIVEPVSTMAFGGALNPIAAARGALATLLTAHDFPAASPRERQALHAWDEWLAHHPHAPEAPAVQASADELRAKLARERASRDLRGANAAAEHGDWDAVEILAARAQRQRPDDPAAADLHARAQEILKLRAARAASSLGVREVAPESLSAGQQASLEELTRSALAGPLDSIAPAARGFADAGAPPELAPELRLLASFEPLARGDEDAVDAALERVPDPWGAPDTASRQAGALLADPRRSAWLHFRAAQDADDRARWTWIALGQFANGAQQRNLWRPLEYLLDLPSIATSVGTFPLRIVQYPFMRSHFGGGVLVAGERYTARYPNGAHAEEVHEELEELYALHGQPGAALRHAEARRAPDPAKIAGYRRDVADAILAAAEKQPRIDVRLAYLAAVVRDYGETPAAVKARKKFGEEKAHASPQRIRLTREFLLEHPALWGPGALGLRPELLDGKLDNGEVAEKGVTLLGRNVVEIALEGREDPALSQVPPDDFARFVARLEEIRRTSLATDAREKAVPDEARDAFFETSRLGLVESADNRPSARSEAVFESTHEKHGFVRTRESILPVDLVLRGEIDTLSLSAFPRIRMPESTPDAMLYQ